MNQPITTVQVRVELFGIPRMRAGLRELVVELPAQGQRAQVVGELARTCPALVGPVLREDLTGLQPGYVFNLNGVAFLDGNSFSLREGDSLLLLSNQAGG